MFVIIDGIDGCGKGKIVEIWAAILEDQGKRVFDLREYQKREHRFPDYAEIEDFDVILSGEPTFAWVGAAIRKELTQKNDRHYSALSIAHAFALDREVLYRRLLLKARRDGKLILQERSFSSSLVYQQTQNSDVTLGILLSLPGNKLAMQHPPDILVIPQLEAKTAIDRLAARRKQDKSIFEKLEFLTRVAKKYYSAWFRKFFENLGTQVVYINTEGTLEETEKQAKEFLKKYLLE